MEEIRIPNDATYAPVALTDLVAGAPLASRILLGATLPGRVVSMAALGLYAGSAARDWSRRRAVRPVDFQAEFGADVRHLVPMPDEARRQEAAVLARRLDRDYVDDLPPRKELAELVNLRLTEFIAGITGQRVLTSDEVREFTLSRALFPFAMGVCDFISGDVAVFQDAGILEPHILGHEFSHRKGWFKELHAQVLSYLALVSSGDEVLVQAALAERLHRQLKTLAGENHDLYHDLLDGLELRPELDRVFRALRPPPTAYQSTVSMVMRSLYDQRLKLTGQNGLSDYDRGFTDFLWTFSRASGVGQDPSLARL
jgi:hypothetical protein